MRKVVQNKRGIALIMAMWIMTILMTVSASFTYMMRMELRLAYNSSHAAQARYLASAGIDAAIAKLRADKVDSSSNYKETDSLHEDWFTYFSENFSCDTSAAFSPMTWDDTWFSLGDGGYSVHLVDESSMQNINVTYTDYTDGDYSLEGLYQLFDQDPNTTLTQAKQKATNIKDYRDSDSISSHATPGGTGIGYEGTGCKNKNFDTIREIQKVKEINEGDNPLTLHARDLTIYSRNKNNCMDRDVVTGTGFSDGDRLNINTATVTQIDNLPVAGLGAGTAQNIINARPYYQVGEVGAASGVGETMLERLADVIKVSNDDEIEGVININTATYWSLRAFYQIGDTKATNIIKTRMGEIADKNGVQKSTYTYGKEVNESGRDGHGRGEIMNTTAIGELSFDNYSDYVTVRSERFRIVSTGIVGTDGSGDGKIDPDEPQDTVLALRKIEATVDRHYHEDGTMGPIEILYWSEAVLEYD